MNYSIVRNDISEMSADAIVLPANPALVEGPGASAALFEKREEGI
jgi:O-acetyl-ADP-ribose deacetylase (regulator of RNase III)